MIEGLLDFAEHFKGATDDERASALESLQLMVRAQQTDERPKAPIRTLGDFLDNPPPVPPELVTPYYLARGTVVGTVARAGVGKTSMGLNRILAWAAGEPQLPEVRTAYVPLHPIKTLIIENEGAGGLFHRKIKTMLDNTDRFTPEQHQMIRENVQVWGEGGYAGIKLDEPESIATIRRGIEEWGPDAVLMEPFARLHSGNENDNSEMNVIGSVIEQMATDYNIGIMVSHHEKKGTGDVEDIMDRARGATALEGFVSFFEFFGKVKGGEQRELLTAKNRYGPEPKVRMEWADDNSGWYNFVPDKVGVDELLNVLSPNSPVFVADLVDELNEKPARVRALLNKAADQGLARGVATGGGAGKGWVLGGKDDNDDEGMEF